MFFHSLRFDRAELPVQRALLTANGQLTVELQVPLDYSRVQLAVSRESSGVMFPPALPMQNRAQFIAETHVRGAERRIAISQLAAWVTRS